MDCICGLPVHLGLLVLTQILALEPPPYECISKPSYQRITKGECERAERYRCDQGLARAVPEGVEQHAKARQGQGKE